MFTGIVREVGRVVQPAPRLVIETKISAKLGDSVAVNGACLTVVEASKGGLAFDVVAETISKTTLGALKGGDGVNLETPIRAGEEFGGHFVQGHVDGVGEIESMERGVMRLRVDADLSRFIAPKGSIAIDGVSLTVVDVDDAAFSVALIPFTLEHTTLGTRGAGDFVNIETDILAKYVARQKESRIDADFLKRAGFLT